VEKQTIAERIADKFHEIQVHVRDKGRRNEKRAVAAFGDPKRGECIDSDLGVPLWFRSIRNASTLEEPAGIDIMVWTDLGVEVPIQIKSSEWGARKFRAAQAVSGKYKTGILFPVITCRHRKNKERNSILLDIPVVVIDDKNHDAIIIRRMIIDSARIIYYALCHEYAKKCGFIFTRAA